MKLFKKLILSAAWVLPVAANAEVNITFQSADEYQKVGVYDWWEGSPFRTGELKGNCKVVNNPYVDEEEAVVTNEKVLGFQRSIHGSNMYGARIDLKEDQRFVLTPQAQYVHVLMRKPVAGRSMLITLGRHNEKTAGYETTWKDQSPEVVQSTNTGNNKALADTWTDVVFPIKGAGNIDIYSLVVVVDCEPSHTRTEDFAAYIASVKINNNSAPEIALVGDYPICFEKDQAYSKTDRKLNSVTVTTEAGTFNMQAGNKMYTEAFGQFIPVKAGETITAQCNYNGSWMHSFFYLDANDNGKFELDADELVAYKNAGSNDFSAKHSFKIPEGLTPGIYRLRGKVDWESTDPAGNNGANGNFIVDNRGAIMDMLLNVYDPAVTTVTVNNDQRNGDILLADGGKIENYSHQRLTSLKVKAQPEKGFDYAGMIIRTGYNMAGDSLVHSNPQWTYKVINYSQFAEDDTYTIPASDFSADVRIEGLMVEKGTLPPAPLEGVTFPYASPAPSANGWTAGSKAYYVQNCANENAWISTAVDYTDLEGNLKLSNGTMPEDEAGQWVVCGTDEEGYQFYNVAAGPGMVLGVTGSEAGARCKMYKTTSVTNDVTTRFDFHENGEGFSFRKHGTEYDCFNSRGQYLALWNNSDAFSSDKGSRLLFVEAENSTVGVNSVAGATVVGTTYDLSGRLYATSKLPAGIYLVEGKKRLVK
ncbi:MAG: lytic polysaccharide monooxygenase auxiliary activity family 9 protein [Bacteroidaceae bacterium]|nr:lytic polysaccharide monooxygenase auxiliary activity family 9 protein [Bacteroidaceae bacterium]